MVVYRDDLREGGNGGVVLLSRGPGVTWMIDGYIGQADMESAVWYLEQQQGSQHKDQQKLVAQNARNILQVLCLLLQTLWRYQATKPYAVILIPLPSARMRKPLSMLAGKDARFHWDFAPCFPRFVTILPLAHVVWLSTL